MFTADLAACVTTGREFPGVQCEPGVPGGVLFINGEDRIAETLIPRLKAAGANLDRIRAIPLLDDLDDAMQWFGLQQVERLAKAIEETRDCRMVVIDPFAAFLGRADENQNAEIREILGRLSRLAASKRVAIVLVTHLNKAGSQHALNRVIGSIGIVGAARCAMLVAEDPADSKRRLLLPLKNNLSAIQTGLAYRISGDPPRLQWEEGAVTIRADEVLAAPVTTTEERTALEEAVEFLREMLAAGPVAANEATQRTAEAGLAPRTIERARRHLKVDCKPGKFRGPWVWSLPVVPDSAKSG